MEEVPILLRESVTFCLQYHRSPPDLKNIFITKKNRVHPAAVPRRTRFFFFCRYDGLCILQEIAAAHSVAKFRSSIGRVNGICDDSCLFEVRQCTTDVRGQSDIFDGFCVSLGRPMSKTGPRKRLSEVSAAVF